MNIYTKFIFESLNELLAKKLLKIISPVELFNDDPKLYHYHIKAESTAEFTDGITREITSSGISLLSRELALFKCLAEIIERFGTCTYSEKNFIEKTYNEILGGNKTALNPDNFRKIAGIRDKKFKWILSENVLAQKKIYIPSQLVFLNYDRKKEIKLSAEVNTVGCAGGFDHNETLLRGIYELVEREAFLAVFLAKLTLTQIDLQTVPDPNIKKVLAACKRYNLELVTINITNDLHIHTFMTFLIDKTGLGQAFTTGIKSHLNPETALIGSIEEAFNTRPWYRKNIYNRSHDDFNTDHLEINSYEKRALYWAPLKQLQHITFLLNSKPIAWNFSQYKNSSADQLTLIKKIFIKKNFSLYYVDITPVIAPRNFRVYRVIIPELQQFYIQEQAKNINYNRINQIVNFFGQDKFTLNPLPHFFL